MKTTLTVEESARLIELGVDPKMASECVSTTKVCASGRGIIRLPEVKPIFNLADILSILTKEINHHHLNIEASEQGYEVCYMLWDNEDEAYHFMGATESPELIDTLYSLLIWAIENKHYNPKSETK